MRAMVLDAPGRPLVLRELARPAPQPHQVQLRVHACGICRTDLHILDGELAHPKLPLVLGHQIVGEVSELGAEVESLALGERVGVPWLGWTCGRCRFCLRGQENLCPEARFTGYQLDGGYAEYAVADARYALRLPDGYAARSAAPLLCAGLIGYRALRMLGEAARLGLYGFGSSAQLVAQLARHEGRRFFAFTRPGDLSGQDFARSLGASWAGGSDVRPPEPLDGAILFAPAGELIPAALEALEPGGAVVCAEIHMSDVPRFPYRLLWGERIVRSVANLTRRDGVELLALAPKVPIETRVDVFPLERANEAIAALRRGAFHGAGVLSLD